MAKKETVKTEQDYKRMIKNPECWVKSSVIFEKANGLCSLSTWVKLHTGLMSWITADANGAKKSGIGTTAGVRSSRWIFGSSSNGWK